MTENQSDPSDEDPFPEMRALVSSNLLGARYDAKTETLTIEFNSGGTYEYPGVSRETADGLFTAASPGSYFYTRIRNAYPGRQIE